MNFPEEIHILMELNHSGVMLKTDW